MKSIKELMEELGFNKNGSEETQKAFINHLIRDAQRLNPPSKSSENILEEKTKNKIPEKSATEKRKSPNVEIQLCFDFEDKKQVS